MSNPYFQFKQFTVFHDQCAMKVGTDAVLLGSWVELNNTQKCLDIGTGTGLLALMLAQRAQKIHVDAVELDTSSCQQASENVQRSPWAEKIDVHHSSIQDFGHLHTQDNEQTEAESAHYDLIISNPPFFIDSTKSADPSKLAARHTDELSQVDLLAAVSRLLNKDGSFAVIYPEQEMLRFEKIAVASGLTCDRMLRVRGRLGKPVRRVLTQWCWSEKEPKPTTLQKQELAIEREQRHQYSEEYIALTKDFYLKF